MYVICITVIDLALHFHAFIFSVIILYSTTMSECFLSVDFSTFLFEFATVTDVIILVLCIDICNNIINTVLVSFTVPSGVMCRTYNREVLSMIPGYTSLVGGDALLMTW